MCILVVIGVLGGLLLATGQEERKPCTVNFGENSSGVGVLNRTFNGIVYCEYLGIRYAEPPVGVQRFKNPTLRAPNGTEEYTNLGSICPQLDALGHATKVLGEEDCLFMNVYSPAVPGGNDTVRKYPVLVYIHGGSYAIWSPQTDMFGVDLLIESGILIVSFNYRLFVLGFLRHPEFNITGNFGLKDQLVAMQWVQRYVAPFGGDPSNITVMGQSVGAHSVTYHMHLEPFRGLFHRAIAMSGSLLAPSAMIYVPENFTRTYLESIHLTSYDQLMEAPFKELFLFPPTNRRFVFATIGLPIFLPTMENANELGALLTKPSHELILEEPVNQVPLMIGMTATEFTPHFTEEMLFCADDNFPNRGNVTVLQMVRKLIAKAALLARKIEPQGAGRHFYGKLTDMANMYFPVKRLLKELREVHRYRAPIFYYRFEYDGRFGKYKNMFYKGELDESYGGAMHGDDLGYLFSPYVVKQALANRSAFETEWKVTERNVEQFSNFVKFGNPTPGKSDNINVLWPAFNSNLSTPQLLNINDENEVREDDDRWNFIYQLWSRIHECLFYYDCSPVEDLLDKVERLSSGSLSSVKLEDLFDDENMT
ncbi:juvenile hormone esterase-like [Toxorhynchites rutilus septentrionalis]|uniref:juvenile hormone esterase-like n=1 Tax=Toxorhynchites rutilus septentrionalis TaxID=329112 RepID=UPI002479C780|nr:juvenile hormone esterase-like [Toxorhynchites rutilus septentrionalis]